MGHYRSMRALCVVLLALPLCPTAASQNSREHEAFVKLVEWVESDGGSPAPLELHPDAPPPPPGVEPKSTVPDGATPPPGPHNRVPPRFRVHRRPLPAEP